MKTYKITLFGTDCSAALVSGTWMYEASNGDWFAFDAPYAIHEDC